MAPPKHQFVVKSRLESNKPFEALEVRSHHDTLPQAEARMQEWLDGKKDLEKAKPEAIIETEEFAHLEDCLECGTPLFRDDMVYHTPDGVYCYDCAEGSDVKGYFDLL